METNDDDDDDGDGDGDAASRRVCASQRHRRWVGRSVGRSGVLIFRPVVHVYVCTRVRMCTCTTHKHTDSCESARGISQSLSPASSSSIAALASGYLARAVVLLEALRGPDRGTRRPRSDHSLVHCAWFTVRGRADEKVPRRRCSTIVTPTLLLVVAERGEGGFSNSTRTAILRSRQALDERSVQRAHIHVGILVQK